MNGKGKYLALLAALSCAALFLILHFLGNIFLPLVIALVLSYLLNPAVSFLARRGVNRTLAIALVFTLLTVIVSGSGYLFYAALKSEFGSVELNLPAYASQVYEIIPPKIKTYLDIETPEKAYAHLNSALQELRGASMSLLGEAFSVVSRAFTSTLVFILTLLGYVITPVYLFYFLADFPGSGSRLLELVPERYRERVGLTATEIDEVLTAFVRGQLTVCAILAVLYSVGLYVIGIDMAILIGTLAGATFIIPYVGTILGILLSVCMAALKFHDLLHPLLCLGWFGIVQAAEGSFITPRMVGDKVGLHPVITILALLVGGQLFGILGMLLAVPVMAVLKVFSGSMLDYYRSSAFFKGC